MPFLAIILLSLLPLAGVDQDYYKGGQLSEVQQLGESVVTAKVDPVTIEEDTVVYNAAALRVSEDASLGELLKKIPGLQISGSKVILHGKEVKKLLINGQKFFGGDVKTGLKNLPADMVEKIRAYERQSDEALLSGIEDGEEEPVLDIKVKKGMMGKLHGNATAGAGLKERFNLRGNANKIEKQRQFSVLAAGDNLPDMGSFTSTAQSQTGSGNDGDSGSLEGGVNFSRKDEKSDRSGHLHYVGVKRYTLSESRSESISSTKTSYASSRTPRDARYHDISGDVTFQDKLRDDLSLYVRPSISYKYNDALANPVSQTFLSEERDSCINRSENSTASFTGNFSAALSGQITKKINSKRGRSINFRYEQSYRSNASDQFNNYYTLFLASQTEKRRKQYIDADTRTHSFSPSLGWNEPLGKGRFLQLTVKGDFRITKSERTLYALTDSFPQWEVGGSHNLKEHLGALPRGWQKTRDANVSYTGTYHYNALVVNLSFRYSRKKIYLTAGVTLRPQWTRIDYVTKDNPSGSENSFVFNAAPTLTLRYNPQKSRQLSLTYRSYPSMPALYDLLPVNSGTSPTYVHTGNSSLKPSFTHNASLSYNRSNLKQQNSLVCNASVWMFQNSISNMSDYDASTGVRSVIPQNISGNWRAKASLGVTQTIRSNTRFSIADNAASEYSHTNSYLYNSGTKSSQMNSTNRFIVKNRFEATYRNWWAEFIISQAVTFIDERYTLRPAMKQSPLNLGAGVSATFIFPWKMRFTAEYELTRQSGYAYSELNRSYNVLNAKLTQPLVRGRLILRLEGFDLLGNLDNITRNFSSSSRSVTLWNGVTRYAILSLVYKFRPSR